MEFEGFSDSVIEGLYWQYAAVDSLFDTEIVFSQFNNSQCIPLDQLCTNTFIL